MTPPITPRQLEIAQLVAAGRSDREIAVALAISPHTVRRHLLDIAGRLGTRRGNRRWQIAVWFRTESSSE